MIRLLLTCRMFFVSKIKINFAEREFAEGNNNTEFTKRILFKKTEKYDLL